MTISHKDFILGGGLIVFFTAILFTYLTCSSLFALMYWSKTSGVISPVPYNNFGTPSYAPCSVDSQTEGVLTELIRFFISDNQNALVGCFRSIRFEVEDDTIIETSLSGKTYVMAPKQVEVLYNPNNPEEFFINSIGGIWYLPAVFLVVLFSELSVFLLCLRYVG